MKRTLKFLARIYPSNWRRRYGAEFDALLEDATPSVRDAFDILRGGLKMQMTRWGFARIVLACSLAGLLVAAAISLAMPVHYVSQAMLTVAPADESSLRALDHLSQDIFSRESLKALMQKDNLYPRERSRLPLNDVVDKMRSSISVHAVAPTWPSSGDTLTFAIAFDYPDRSVVQQVSGELASAFIEGNLDGAHSHSTFELFDSPSKPVGPNRAGLAGVGLLTGLLVGLGLVFVARSRRGTAVCPACGQRMPAPLTVSPPITGKSGDLSSASAGTSQGS